MGYKEGRVTISKEDCLCTKCYKAIKKGDQVWVEPGKLVIHTKCHKKDDKTQ